jgi:DNA-binding NarL/FixJ family response regulator
MRLAESQIPDPSAPLNGGTRLVTDREVEILRLVQQGKSNHEIGAALGISPLTVKNHVQKIYRKLSVQNRAHAVSRGISLRLLDYAAG